MLTRRRIVIGGIATASGLLCKTATDAGVDQLAPRVMRASDAVSGADFEVAERLTALPCFDGRALPLWTFQDGPQLPVVRVKAGAPFEATIKNSLPRVGEHITIHWHGLRIANGQDGVAFMTQEPIQPGGRGTYTFTPRDTGTYFFHTHCNSVEHFGRGLFGVLIVEGDETEPSDADIVLVMKDWRLSAERDFLPFTTDDGAAKAGTAGTVRAVNGATRPTIEVPASANVRLRLLNVDPTRISEVGIEGAIASIIAVDGNPCRPMPLTSWRFGPASRLDILLRSPKAGGVVRLLDYFAREPVVLAELSAAGAPRRRDRFAATPLKSHVFAKADLANAERLTATFSATATGAAVVANSDQSGLPIGALCLSKRSFWAINKQAWPSADHKLLGPPLFKLALGRSYIFELQNLTSQPHPIHVHGHTFEVLSSSLRKLFPRHRADTVLLLPKERIEVALVADNPGKWMFHCHILEHQETGMMGHIEVA